LNFCSKIQLLETLHPDKTQEMTKKLLNKDYNYFVDKSFTKDSSYDSVLSELKSFKSSFAHDKESKLNRELIVKSNVELEDVGFG
jgi:NAD-dependent DNA ligase